MSTGLNCEIVEWQPSQWYYVLEDDSAPKLSFDWREFATAYGPFSSDYETREHLHDNHANPGGYSIERYSPSLSKDKVLADLVQHAKKGRRVPYYGWRE